MKFLRLLVNLLALAALLIVVLVALAFAPIVQTWVAQMVLDGQPAVQGSLESVSAGLRRIEVGNLHLKFDGAALTLPALEAELPLVTAGWNRRFQVHRLVARGWTLDLRQNPEPKGAGEPAAAATTPPGGRRAPAAPEIAAAQEVARIFRGTLSRWALPCDLSLDGVELEGDVLFDAPAGSAPRRVHVTVKGGGMAAGQEGAFDVEASSMALDQELSVISVGGHGRLTVAMSTPRSFSRVQIKAELSADGGPFPKDFTLSADAAVTLGAGEEVYSVDLSRGGQHLATVLARFQAAASRFAGTWKIDLQDSDIAQFAPRLPLPHFTAAGTGQFDSDAAFSWVHALGRLNASASRLEVIAPALERLGEVTFAAGFDAVRSGHSVKFEHLSVSLPETRPVVVAESLQSFDFDEKTGDFRPVEPAGDWAEISIQGFPLAGLSDYMNGFAFSGGEATGAFLVRAEKGGFEVRPKAPLRAAGVALQRAGRPFSRGLDLSVSLLASYNPQGWQLQLAPLAIANADRRLATVEAKLSSPAGPDQPIAIAGTWTADLRGLAAKMEDPDFRWLRGRAASGDFTAKVGASTELDGKVAVVGRDERHTITASVHGELDGDGRISFRAPVKIVLGRNVSDLSAEGTRIRDDTGTRLYLKLTGKSVVLEHLGLLAAPLGAGEGPSRAGSAATGTAAAIRDRTPFWGDWTGNVAFAFDRVKAAEAAVDNVGGILHVDRNSIHLEGGHLAIADKRDARIEGSISFDAAADSPYSLKAATSLDRVDAESLFAAMGSRKDPTIEGRFSVAATLAGTGANLGDLVNRTQEEFRLTSTAGIVRLFKTDVDEAIPPEPKAPVSDALGAVAYSVGSFFGAKDTVGTGRRKIPPITEAVIAVTNEMAEIGFDEITVTAVRGIDRTIHIVNFAMTAPDKRITGSGQVTYVKGVPLRAQPFSVDLQFGARDRTAKLLSAAGLLSGQKDASGYALLLTPVHFGGTIEQIDGSQWHDLLVKAATPVPAAPKKSP